MKPTFHLISFVWLLASFVALASGSLWILWKIRAFNCPRHRWLFVLYFCGLFIYFGTLYTGSQLNPRDMGGGSPTDTLFRGISIGCFFVCLPLPLFARAGWSDRLLMSSVNFMILAFSFWLWYVSTA
jgi:hypothetical protein